MSPFVATAADAALHLAHLGVIVINLFGWIHPRTRNLHRVVVCLTLASWLLPAPWYGLGYCVLTDVHWGIKEQLGEQNPPSSYIQYVLSQQPAFDIPAGWVDAVVGGVFVAVVGIMAVQWIGEIKQRNNQSESA
jgi:hypothetical protein